MNRRSFLSKTVTLAAGSFLFQKQLAAAFFKTFEANIRMLRGDVGIFTERGGTIGFYISREGIVVIDSQFADTAANFMNEVRKQTQQPFCLLLNTHHHADHTSGNIAFKGLVQNIICHQNCLTNHQRVSATQNNTDKQLFANETFSRTLRMRIGDEKITAQYFGAAHTNGDAIYHFTKANVVHVGDLMFNRRHPFVDRSSGANMRNWINVLDDVKRKMDRDTIYIFGHSLNPGGETGTAEDLTKFQDYLSQVLNFAEKEIKAGKSKEEFIKNTSIPGVTEWSGQGIERPLTAAYEEVVEEKKIIYR